MGKALNLSGNEKVNLAVVSILGLLAAGMVFTIYQAKAGDAGKDLIIAVTGITGGLIGYLSRDVKHTTPETVTVNNTPENPVQVEEKKP